MKKVLLPLFLAAFLLAPHDAHAIVNSINGLTALNQSLVTPGSNATNTMHMDIITVDNDKHRFRWDGTPWRVNQGGTGLTSIPLFGQLLMGNGTGGYTLVATSSLGIGDGGGGGGTPAGPDKAIQVNDAGNFGGSSELTWAEQVLAVNGSIQLTGTNGVRRLSMEVPEGIGGGRFYINVANYGDGIGSGAILKLNGGNQVGSGGSTILEAGSANSPEGEGGTLSLLGGGGNIPGPIDIVAGSDGNGTNGHIKLSGGYVGTTTINFGEQNYSDSRVCFNTKNTDGDDISFYFVGTSMVVEANPCE